MRTNAVTSGVEYISPELAAKWLEKNRNNRSSSYMQVAKYARDMEAGNWGITNQGIGFDFDGWLVDGQHRLLAIVRAAVGVYMVVTRGLPPESRRNVDMGYNRDIAGILHMEGRPNSKALVARVRVVSRIMAKTKIVLSLSQWESVYQAFKEGIDWSLEVVPTSSGKAFAKSTVAGAMAFAYCDPHKEAVDRFAKSVVANDGLRPGSISHLLNNYLMINALAEGERRRRAGSYDPVEVVIRKTLRALHLEVTGQTIQKLQDGMYGIEYFRTLHEQGGRTLDFLRVDKEDSPSSAPPPSN